MNRRVTARTHRTWTRGLGMASLLALGAAGVGAPGDIPPSTPRALEMVASRFKFEPETLEVTEGERVRLTLHSIDTEHGFSVRKLHMGLPSDSPRLHPFFAAAASVPGASV